MDHARRVSELWNWLPAFRAVAESEHLPTAAEHLHLSASALSRTIRLLEDSVGRPLFDRLGRRIELNDAGKQFLAAVRTAMRTVHEGLVSIDGGRYVGSVRIAAFDAMIHTAVVPGLLDLKRAHPELVGHVQSGLPSNPAGALLAGLLDVVFTTRPVHGEHVECVQLPNLPMALFCSEALANEELSPAGCWFVVPPADQHCPEADGWPGDAARSIAAFIDGVWPRLLACASSKWVTAAPNVPAVRSYAEALGLKVVGADQLRPISVFASHRTSLAGSGRVEAVVECVRVQLDRAAPSTRPSFVGE